MKRTLRMLLAIFTCTRMVAVVSLVPVANAAPLEPIAIVQHEAALSVEDFLNDTNVSREAVGLQALRLDPQLVQAAQTKAEDMIARNYWSHYGPKGDETPWHFITNAGYSYKVAGENLARGYSNADQVTEAWLKSPAHAANLLSPRYTDVGFACVKSYDADGNMILLTVQMFGSR
jgi:uncharacterized protein YkwD